MFEIKANEVRKCGVYLVVNEQSSDEYNADIGILWTDTDKLMNG